MANISIGFSKPKKFMIAAWAISKWMRKPYCHAYIKMNVYGVDYVYQASHGSVHFAKYQDFLVGNEAVVEYSITVSEPVMESMKAKCIKLQGEKYSYWGVVQIAAWDTLHTFGIKASMEDRKGYFCSELVGRICVEDLKIEFEKPTYLLTPSDCDNKLGDLYAKVS